MPYYINPRDGTLAYDANLPAGAFQTNDPNVSGVKLAPTDSWYAMPGNGGFVYIKAGVPVPGGTNNQWAMPYQAIDDQGTHPPSAPGEIHTPPATDAASWKLPGRGQFENQAWSGPSDWRGVPFAQMDTQGRPLSSYNNAVDQLQQARQPISTGFPFARWAFGGGMLGQGQQGQQGQQSGQGGLLGQGGQQPPVTTDSSSAGGYFGQQPTPQPAPTWTPPTWANPSQTATPATTPAAPAQGAFNKYRTPVSGVTYFDTPRSDGAIGVGIGGNPYYGLGPTDKFQGQTDPAYNWFKPGDLGYATRADMYAARSPWLSALEQANSLAQYGFNAANPYVTVPEK